MLLSRPIDPIGTEGSGVLGEIAAAARALLTPSPALFYQVRQERLRTHRARLSSVDQSLQDARQRAFAAAVRLVSLDPQPRTRLSSYMDVLSISGERE